MKKPVLKNAAGALYIYELKENGDPLSYDECIAAACMQGLFNRRGPYIYITCRDDEAHRNGKPGTYGWGDYYERETATPCFWLEQLTSPGFWLSGRKHVRLSNIDALFELTRDAVKGAVIWDTELPCTVNIATTIAGVEDLIVMSQEFYESFGKKHSIPIKADLRKKFDGHISGSAKNDAYRWAIENYLKKGLCSDTLVGDYDDAWMRRERGQISCAVERDRLIAEKAFTFDLMPWDFFTPDDDPQQTLGTDKQTMLMIFEAVYENCAGRNMTEFCGFYNHIKNYNSKRGGVPTEWEQVYLMSPYNFYQNTVANDVYNQSLHKWAKIGELVQNRPEDERELENKVYMCIQVCDMDSTTPLYDCMLQLWKDPRRGELPLAWGLNPNLSGVLPDVFDFYYRTASENDYFCSDASAAGYFNPSRIKDEHWDMVIRHNKYWFDRTDMTIAGMVLDGDHPTKKVIESFAEFAPDGYAALVSGNHGGHNLRLDNQVYNGMPVTAMTESVCDWKGLEGSAKALNEIYFSKMSSRRPEFLYYRICYRYPSELYDLYRLLQKTNPQLSIELVDPYTYFDMLKKACTARHGLEPRIGRSE